MQKIRGYKDCKSRANKTHNVYFRAPKQKKNNGKRMLTLLKRIGGFVTVVSIVISAVKIYDYFTETDKFNIRNIEINYKNKDYINDVLIRNDVVLGKNIFRTNLGAVKKSLKLNFNLHNIDVKRKLPDTIVINAEDRVPIAYITSDKFQIDKDYVITINNEKEKKDLPVIVGYEVQPDEIGRKTNNKNLILCLRTLDVFNKTNDKSPSFSLYKVGLKMDLQVKEIDISDSGSFDVKTNDGMSVFFGQGKLDKKIKRLESLLTDLSLKGKNAVSVDLRFRNEAAVKIK